MLRKLVLLFVLAFGGVAVAAPDAAPAHAATVAPAPVAAPDAAPSNVIETTAPVAVPSPDTDTAGWAHGAFDAVKDKNWRYLAALVLIGVVSLVRKYGSKALPVLATGRGAWATAIATGIAGAVGTALAAHQTINLDLAIYGAQLGLVSAGLWKGWAEFKPAKTTPPPTPVA